MDPTKIRMRYLLGIFVMAVATATVLRHFLHVEAGFTRKPILVGALITATIGIFLAVVFCRRRPRP
jgi:hypothetical protein